MRLYPEKFKVQKQQKRLEEDMLKVCSICNNTKRINEFPLDGSTFCNVCVEQNVE
jgi:hypothetical protein